VPQGLRRKGCRIARTARIYPGPDSIGDATVGERSFVNSGCVIDGGTVIGDDVHVARNATILSADHQLAGSTRRAGEQRLPPVTIALARGSRAA
jgi:acetyltransferase-like isoleucine patch superfamily enzyme